MRIRWTQKALRNLEDEIEFIGQDDPQAAKLVARRVIETLAVLVGQPGIGRPGRVHGTRELVVLKTRYLVPYRVRGEVVEILRVFHTSRRLPGRW